jgi:hypothetical protein
MAAVLIFSSSACTSQDEVEQHGSPTARESAELTAGLNPRQLQHAHGVFTSQDGQITGEVSVNVVLDNGRRFADLDFTGISAPYDVLGVGGSLAPRGDDPCFDAGLRASSGEWSVVDSNIPMAMEISDGSQILHEIILYESHYYGDSEHGCVHTVVARAPLLWE